MDAATEKAMAVLGRNILEMRQHKGWSAEKLAAEAGVSFASIYAYENGKREPKITQAMAVARALGVGLDELVRGVSVAA
jgi:transcriptional regulator with XRE-family HTH domain